VLITIQNDGIVDPFDIKMSRDSMVTLMAETRDMFEESDADGDIDFGTEYRMGEFTLQGVIEYDDVEGKYLAREALAEQINTCRTPQMLIYESDADKYTMARVIGIPEIEEYPTWMKVTINFSLGPIWKSYDENTQVGSGTITNAGTFETPVVVEIAGPVTDPVVEVGDDSLEYTGEIEDGETLIIDTDTKTVKLDGVNAIDGYNDEFPMLQTGDTVVVQSAAGTTTFKWRDAWI
jgi:phage-related protein